MDKTFWQNIMSNNYIVPAGYSITTLTPRLLSYAGSLDPEMREELMYPILDTWIHQGSYSHTELWRMARQLLQNLTTGLGEQNSDTVFLRSSSLLILAEIVYYNLTHPILEETEVRQVLEQVLAYFSAEKDLRGYDTEKGWVHVIAHTADLLWVLAQQSFMVVADIEHILNAIAEKITAPVAHIYLYDEDERLTRTVMGILQRDLLSLPFLTAWLKQLTHPEGRIAWNESFEDGRLIHVARSKVETCARHNTKHFLRSLYFQLHSPGFANMTFIEQHPTIGNELLPLVENALARIQAWC